MDRVRCVVLGFYDRQNLGDEAYKLAVPAALGTGAASFEFVSTDDALAIPDGVDVVLVGGGDVINAYFMEKVLTLLAGFAGRVYAFSVGVPYAADAFYLRAFDHAFVRSSGDRDVAVAEVGARNVTLIPDAAYALRAPRNRPAHDGGIAVCLAQPVFHDHAAAAGLLRRVAEALAALGSGLRIVLLAFNTSDSPQESDVRLCADLRDLLQLGGRVAETPDVTDAEAMLAVLDGVDAVLCMRYHSLIFARLLRKPTVALFCSPKMRRAARDAPAPVAAFDMGDDCAALPSVDALAAALAAALTEPEPAGVSPSFAYARELIFEERRLAAVPVAQPSLRAGDTFECAVARVEGLLKAFLGVASLPEAGPLPCGARQPLDVARLICYALARTVQCSCVWGLRTNLVGSDFVLMDALRFLWGAAHPLLPPNVGAYFPQVAMPSGRRRAFPSVDAAMRFNDYGDCHRSGWAFAVGGLRNIDAKALLRPAPALNVDTYVDRTFHWGAAALEAAGVIPYLSDWVGIVHHTFDVTHSSFNCRELFERPAFLASLPRCRALIALSETLAAGLRAALTRVEAFHVKVFAATHPMESVELRFTMGRFFANRERRLVQIGAWLRNPYSIYELPMWRNPLQLRKTALRGKDMSQYFPPDGWRISALCDGDPGDGGDAMCRPCHPDGGDALCRPDGLNKFCQGLSEALERNVRDVDVLEKLSNADYDALLSRNLVFLDLVDCSAVNTVLECLVRDTPVALRRHAALEDLLGADYPGFFDDLVDATHFVNDVDAIQAAHEHLAKRDKSRVSLDRFVTDVQAIVAACGG